MCLFPIHLPGIHNLVRGVCLRFGLFVFGYGVVAFAEFLKPKNVVLGGDVRLTSEALKHALANGIRDTGADVIDIGIHVDTFLLPHPR